MRDCLTNTQFALHESQMFSAPFPQPLVDLYKVLAGVTLGIEVASPQCVASGMNYYTLFSATMVGLILAMLVIVKGPLATIAQTRAEKGFRAAVREVIVSKKGGIAFRDLFVVVLLLHPSVSGKAMEFFRCREIDGVPFLMADYSIECHDDTWYFFLPVVVVVLVFFSLGTPLVIVRVLHARHNDGTLYNEDGTVTPQPLDILYGIYQPRAYWYESVQMFFKLALWSALVFFEHGSEMQLATALVVNVLQLCVHIEFKPMGGEEAWLLNVMQACTLILTT